MIQKFEYKRATMEDIDELVRTRIIVLRAANKLPDDEDMSVVEKESYAYYRRALETGEHIAYLVYDNGAFVGAGGVSFYQVMPTYHNPTGKKAYIMNMYTAPEYRRQGIAIHTLDIVKQFARVLKTDGKISIVKHNRAGRVMQMVVLLNDFKHAYSLLDGNDGMASKYGAIHYYEDTDIEKWCPELVITKTLGIRTFWDMQQNQEIHKDADWQDKMVEIEMRVSDMNGYKDIAFFHHLMFEER